MEGPWTKYEGAQVTASDGPWNRYAQQPEPPPGVIVHDTNRSYVTGSPAAPSVDTKGMTNEQRNLAAGALQMRQNAPFSTRPLAPLFQGLSASYGDEAVSALRGLTGALRGGAFGDSYSLAQEAQRQDLAQERAEHPIRSTGGQVLGALAQAPALGSMMRAGQALPLAGRMAAGAGIGAGYGAAEGFGSGSGLDDRLKQAAIGGGLGGVIGGAAAPIAAGTKAAVNKVLDSLSVGGSLRREGIQRPAANAVMRALSADDAFSGVGARNIVAAGPQAMLADAGPATRGTLDAVAQRGGPAALVTRRAVDERGAGANLSLRTALDDVLGAPQGTEAAAAGIRQASQPARAAAYDAAYLAPIDYAAPAARDLETALTRVPSAAFEKANALMKLEGAKSKQIMASVGENGAVTFETLPDVRQLDYITRSLRHLAEAGEDAGKLGARTDFSRSYSNLARDIRGTMRQLVPEYGVALDTAADPISRINATRVGAQMLSPAMARDEVAMAVNGMSKPERSAVRQGIRSYVDDLMANVRAVASDPNQDAREAITALNRLNSRAVREKLTTVLDPNEALRLAKEIGQATKAAELHAGMTRNSATYGRMAVAEANKQLSEPGPLGSLMEGKPLQAAKRATQVAFGRTPQDKLRAEDEMNRQIAELLTGRRGDDALEAMRLLTRAYLAGPQNAGRAGAIAENLGAGSGLAGYQLLRTPQRD